MKDEMGGTALHYAARSHNTQCLMFLLSLYSESERLPALREQDLYEKTATI